MAYQATMEARLSQILHRDVEFSVKQNGNKLGTLKVSKGGVEWVPSGHSVNTVRLNWRKFAERMEG